MAAEDVCLPDVCLPEPLSESLPLHEAGFIFFSRLNLILHPNKVLLCLNTAGWPASAAFSQLPSPPAAGLRQKTKNKQ